MKNAIERTEVTIPVMAIPLPLWLADLALEAKKMIARIIETIAVKKFNPNRKNTSDIIPKIMEAMAKP